MLHMGGGGDVLVALIEFDCDIDCSTLPLWLILPWPLLLMSTLAVLLASFDCVLKLASAPGMIICSAVSVPHTMLPSLLPLLLAVMEFD